MPRKKKEDVKDKKESKKKAKKTTVLDENIKLHMKEIPANSVEKPPPKKRGRKPKVKDPNYVKPPPKKRGRKPKGGKIVQKNIAKKSNFDVNNQNIILHLKCNTEDLNKESFISIPKYDPDVNINDPKPFTFDSNNTLNYKVIDNKSEISKYKKKIELNKNTESNKQKEDESETNMKEIWNKLNKLKVILRKNNIIEKKSSCFWCTYDFDTPTIYIPQGYNKDKLEAYGCFCSPECAVSYLKNENLDDSTKWERYALLNNVYSKIYNYEKNIKPAPNPFYTLDKYYGNLSIQEYRKLLNNDSILLVANKPMTKILPELYEENNELPKIYENLVNINANVKTTNYRLQRNNVVNTKNNILSNNFNLVK
mgnify:CR=1 FL=1|tara:strand:- start:166 stop:1266 length:1101 start_codon:yes stop_codon:yes gene_type:complete